MIRSISKGLTILILAVTMSVLAVTADCAALAPTFTVKVAADLCPEYRFGGVSLEATYFVPGDAAPRRADILEQQIDVQAGTAVVQLVLPSTLGTIPIDVRLYCRDEAGLSAPSNGGIISNCDVLALIDSDADGVTNNQEDLNCDNFFSPGDASNPDNVDTDGDGVRDLVELLSRADPTNPGSSPRPYVFSSGPFDPDADGTANPVVWRRTQGMWFIRDFATPGNNLAIQFGLPGDVPFVYRKDGLADVGVIRRAGSELHWYFHGPSLGGSSGVAAFGLFGDNIALGPWEQPGVTNIAVARLFNNQWTFDILLSNGTVKSQNWGGNGDIPKVQDYDGDGIFDIAVFRPSEGKTYIIRSRNSRAEIVNFGSGTADHTVRGDFTGDGTGDISFWEPISGMFQTLKSDFGFNETSRFTKDANYYEELQLGLYNVHLPLSWNRVGGVDLYTVVEHDTGLRFYRAGNSPAAPIQTIQWGLPGDSQG